ncbi:MAG: TerB family tellurite resistance protein [Myxococcota bacterium]
MHLRDLDNESRMRLVRFVCSFAWADLEIQDAERALVMRMLEQLELDDDEKGQAERWLKVPPPPEDVDPLDIPQEHRQLFLNTVLEGVGADGRVDSKEIETLSVFEKLLRVNPDDDDLRLETRPGIRASGCPGASRKVGGRAPARSPTY